MQLLSRLTRLAKESNKLEDSSDLLQELNKIKAKAEAIGTPEGIGS